MQSPFASYRGGFQVLPQGWMESATAPGRNYAQGAQALGSSMVKAAGVVRENMGEQASNVAAAPTLMSQYEQMSQATGQEMDPTIIDRFSKLGDMSGSQLAQFNKDVGGALGFQKDLYTLGMQQKQFALQQQALQQARYRQNLGTAQDAYLNAPAPTGAAPQLNFGGMNPGTIMNAQPGQFSSSIPVKPYWQP